MLEDYPSKNFAIRLLLATFPHNLWKPCPKNSIMFAKIWPLYIWSLLACVLVFAALNRHSRSIPYTYSSQVMSDKAGYYVYLPALFLYQFKAQDFPAKVDSLTGSGFYLNLKNNKVHSKYPVGTAVLISPFFLTAHLFVTLSGGLADGFSMPYQNAINLAAVFYLLLGIYFLNRFLLNYFSQKIAVITHFTCLFGLCARIKIGIRQCAHWVYRLAGSHHSV